MKKIFKILIILFIFVIILEVLFAIFGNGYNITYTILNDDKSYKVEETYIANNSSDDHYEITINNKFFVSIYDNLFKDSRLIKNIEEFSDGDLSCIYINFKSSKLKRDVICNIGGKQKLYHNIVGYNSKLDEFVNNLDNYDINMFKDDLSNKIEKGLVKVYNNNIIKNHFIDLQKYKGIYNINNEKIIELDYYKNDVYNPKLTISTDKYLISANYENDYSFDSIYIIDISNNQKKEIKLKESVSYDSYFQGEVNKKIYLFDKTNKKQYEIDPKKGKINEVGNEKKGILYYSGKWENKNALEFVNSEIKFQNIINYQNDSYDKIEMSNNFYYLFDYYDNKVKVSKIDINNTNYITEIFEVNSIRNIKYVNDYIFFIDGDDIKYYSDRTGVRTIINYSELTFNKNLNYFVYIK